MALTLQIDDRDPRTRAALKRLLAASTQRYRPKGLHPSDVLALPFVLLERVVRRIVCAVVK